MPTLEQKIRKYNEKELQELTFGCEVKRFENTAKELYIGAHTVYRPSTYQLFDFNHTDDIEIIGHPIELRHVLIAIEKSGKTGFSVNSHGNCFAYVDDNNVTQFVIDLSLPFSQWSPEVHEFINKLID